VVAGPAHEELFELMYPAATLGLNYIDFGCVRRGLGGTLV
jgi:hypothetical protein